MISQPIVTFLNKVALKCLIFAGVLIHCMGCASGSKAVYELPANAAELISGQQSKTWKLARRFNNGTRMNMGDCFLSYRVTYHANNTMRDNNGEYTDCGPSLQASWKVMQDEKGWSYIRLMSDQLPALMNIEENYKFFKIIQLSDQQLTLEFRHAQTTQRKTKIIDVLVPQEVNVEGREFHW